MNLPAKMLLAYKNATTYKVGLLQAKAYRILRKETGAALSGTDISSIDWAFLGLLFESKKKNEGMRSKDIAHELGTRPPFITELSKVLEKKGMIEISSHQTDARTNLIQLTAKGQEFVSQTEKNVRAHMKNIVKNINPKDILCYLAVLQGIVENEEESKRIKINN